MTQFLSSLAWSNKTKSPCYSKVILKIQRATHVIVSQEPVGYNELINTVSPDS